MNVCYISVKIKLLILFVNKNNNILISVLYQTNSTMSTENMQQAKAIIY